jgi:hypothetical protein
MRDGTQMPGPPWRRHELLHVAPDVWASALAHRPALADRLRMQAGKLRSPRFSSWVHGPASSLRPSEASYGNT